MKKEAMHTIIKGINIFNVSFCIHFREKRHVKIYLHSLVFVIL